MAQYPGSIYSFTTVNNGDTSDASQIDNPSNEIVAIETGLLNGFQHDTLPSADNTYASGTAAKAWKAVTTLLLKLRGSSSGTLTVQAAAAAGTNTLTLPAGTTDFSATGGTSQFVKQTSAGGALTVAAILETDQPNFVDWTDYSGTSTVTGWASFSVKKIYYKRIGKLAWVAFELNGTSNATTVSFTLPYTSDTNINLDFSLGFTEDNGSQVSPNGYGELPANSSTVTCNKSVAGGGWTNTGTKIVRGQFFFQTT